MIRTLFKNNNKIKWLTILLATLCLFACENDQREIQVVSGEAFGSINYKILIADNLSSGELKKLVKDINAELSKINNIFSTWQTDTEISKFNTSAVGTFLETSEEFWYLLEKSRELHALSDGYLDITLGNVINHYGFGNEKSAKLGSFGFESLEFDSENKKIKRKKDIKLNMSSVVEGYSLEQMEKILLEMGLKNFLIELGGEILTRGKKIDDDWTLAIEKPNDKKQEIQEIIKVKKDRLVLDSSGGYKNFDSNSKNIHIINPKSGRPTTTKLYSVSIIDEDAIKADGLATAMVAMGVEQAMEFAKKNNIATYITFFDEKKDSFETFISDAWLKIMIN